MEKVDYQSHFTNQKIQMHIDFSLMDTPFDKTLLMLRVHSQYFPRSLKILEYLWNDKEPFDAC